jgi:hypothetical protein
MLPLALRVFVRDIELEMPVARAQPAWRHSEASVSREPTEGGQMRNDGNYRRSCAATASIAGSRPARYESIVHGAGTSGASVGTAIGFVTTGP